MRVVLQVFRYGGFWLKVETQLLFFRWEANASSTIINISPGFRSLGLRNMLLLRIYSR